MKLETPTVESLPGGDRQETRSKPRKKIVEFDILRTVAILLLFFHHGGIYNFSVLGFPLSPLNHYVELFLLGSFVFMAGYLSVGSFQKKRKGDLIEFIKSKVIRIYIPYVLALSLFILILGVKLSRSSLLIHLLGVQILLAPRETRPVYTLWYIGLILVYYVLFAFLMKYIRKLPYLTLAFLIAFATAFLIRTQWDLIERRFFFYFFVYAAGILLAKTDGLQKLTSARFFLVDKILLFGLGVAAFTPFHNLDGQPFSLPLALAANLYVLSAVLLALSLARLFARREPDLRFFSFVSFASFFAYLFHRPIWDVLLVIYTSPSKTVTFLYLILVGASLVLIISFFLQRVYNRYIVPAEEMAARILTR